MNGLAYIKKVQAALTELTTAIEAEITTAKGAAKEYLNQIAEDAVTDIEEYLLNGYALEKVAKFKAAVAMVNASKLSRADRKAVLDDYFANAFDFEDLQEVIEESELETAA